MKMSDLDSLLAQLQKEKLGDSRVSAKSSTPKEPERKEAKTKKELLQEQLEKLKREMEQDEEGEEDLEEKRLREELERTNRELRRKKEEKARMAKNATTVSESRRREEQLVHEVESLRKKVTDMSSTSRKEPMDSVSRLELLKEQKKELERKAKELEMRPADSSMSSATARRLEELDREKASLSKKIRELPSKEALASARASEQRNLDRVQYGIDICFCMDCTGSMGSFIEAAKTKIREIIEEVKHIEQKAILRIGFVGYRDHCDGALRLEVVDFVDSSNLKLFTDQLASCPAVGGGDIPEDIAGGLKVASELSWNSSTRLIIHFADAPCHGSKYHRCEDSYPGGDPNGLNPEDLLKIIIQKRVDYYFMKINSTTDLMVNIFQQVFESCGKEMVVNAINANAADFVPKVVKSISSSMMRSAAFKESKMY